MSRWCKQLLILAHCQLSDPNHTAEQLAVDIPELPPYDPDKDEKFPWEDEVAAAIEKLKAEAEAEKAAEEQEENWRSNRLLNIIHFFYEITSFFKNEIK